MKKDILEQIREEQSRQLERQLNELKRHAHTIIYLKDQLGLLPGGPDSEGARLILGERLRQICEEDCSAAHDDTYVENELAWAATCYAAPKYLTRVLYRVENLAWPDGCRPWPWEPVWDKREKHDRIRQLTIAGALCAAEIDRLKRLESKEDE